MPADRWYYLRHPDGFSSELFDCVRSGWEFWKLGVQLTIRHWQQTPLASQRPPAYEWFEPELAADIHQVTIPLGGQGSYGSYHLFEEAVPADFHRFLPAWFLIDLELGRRDTAGWFPNTTWVPVVKPAERDAHKRIFRRPAD